MKAYAQKASPDATAQFALDVVKFEICIAEGVRITLFYLNEIYNKSNNPIPYRGVIEVDKVAQSIKTYTLRRLILELSRKSLGNNFDYICSINPEALRVIPQVSELGIV